MLEYDFEESIGYWVVLTAQAIQKALNDELSPHGITFRQSQVLAWLALKGELAQFELAHYMMIEPPTLVGVLDRMERDGLIRRECSETDRRRKIVCANPEADEVWGQVAACARRVRGRASRGLTERQLKTLKKLLRAVLENLNEDAGDVNTVKTAVKTRGVAASVS